MFTLELLGLGAPPELVSAAQAAAADEIEHARLSFAIASRFADAPVGPGAIDVGKLAPETDLARIAAACVRDGCLNETLASAIAAAQAENANDPEIRRALERIAEDEARHAELAWRFVAWALTSKRADVRAAVMAAFEAPVASEVTVPAGVDEGEWRQYGRLTAREHAGVVRAVLEDVIAPCRARLLAGLSGTGTGTGTGTG
jgi:hypothetical protein